MNTQKYRILRDVRYSIPTSPVRRTDYYKHTRKILRYRQYINELINSGLLSEDPGNSTLRLTSEGLAAIEAEEYKRRESVRYWVTTAIAILALIISIIALLSQLGILQLQPGLPPG